MLNKKKVLVYGATGQQGMAVALNLLGRGYHVRALARSRAKAGQLEKAGAEIVAGDLSNIASLQAASSGIDSAFLVLPLIFDRKAGLAWGKNAIDAAKSAGIRHIVFSSGGPMPEKVTDVSLIEIKRDVENYLKSSGVPSTILRPAPFMENFAAPWSAPLIMQKGIIAQPMPASVKTSYIAVNDIGALAAEAISRPELAGSAFNIGGPQSLSGNDVARLFSKIVGRPVNYVEVPLKQFEDETNAQLGRPVGTELAKMNKWFSDIGGAAFDMAPVVQKLPVKLTSLEEWVKNVFMRMCV